MKAKRKIKGEIVSPTMSFPQCDARMSSMEPSVYTSDVHFMREELQLVVQDFPRHCE